MSEGKSHEVGTASAKALRQDCASEQIKGSMLESQEGRRRMRTRQLFVWLGWRLSKTVIECQGHIGPQSVLWQNYAQEAGIPEEGDSDSLEGVRDGCTEEAISKLGLVEQVRFYLADKKGSFGLWVQHGQRLYGWKGRVYKWQVMRWGGSQQPECRAWQKNVHRPLEELQIWHAFWKAIWQCLPKTQMHAPFDPTVPLPGIYLLDLYLHKCTKTFVQGCSLYVACKKWK